MSFCPTYKKICFLLIADVRMPRSYTRKTNRQSWSTTSMLKAIEAVNKGEMGWLRASKVFGVPQATLRRHALKTNKVIKAGEKQLGRFKTIFPPEVERQLVEHLKLLESRFFGLTRKDVLSLAYLLAVRNGFQHCFNNETKTAGKDWLREFRRRNPDIALRKPEATSAARAQAFNKPQVAQFFKILEDVIKKENINNMNIYNADESALSTVQRPQKIFATTGRKQVGAITSAERGSHVTVVCCMSSNGNFIPPALIFPRKNMKKELVDHAPPGTLGIAQESGWMTGPVFLQWLEHFQKFTKASTDQKVLLIIDGHSSHKYLDALIYAKQHGIVLLCLPPHCTHRMQPLDVSFFGPLKTYFDQEVSKWLKTHPGRVVTQFQIGALFTEAYGKAATIQNATNGFYKTGICPLNADVFPDYMFEAAETTNVPINNDPQEEHNIDNNPIAGPSSNSLPERENNDESQTLEKKVPTQQKESSLTATVADLSPLPVGPFIAGQGKRKPRKRQGTIVLNSTPNLEEAKGKTGPKVYEKRRTVTKQLLVDFEPAIKKVSKKRRIVTQPLLVESGSELEEEPFSADEEDDCACIYCIEEFKRSKPGEIWLRCCSCSRWAHAECAGVDKKTKTFICEICSEN